MDSILTLAHEAHKLKTTKRSGWVLSGIKHSESVADHSYRVALLALFLGDALKLNTKKLLSMALIHDLAESHIGDIISEGPGKETRAQQKPQLEQQAMEELFAKLTNKKKYLALWREFEDAKTKEAQLLHEIDRLELLLQALEYERAGALQENMNQYWDYSPKYFKSSLAKKLFTQLLNERKEKR